MATKHWVRDAQIIEDVAAYGQQQQRTMALMYHFLVNAGFINIWECDGGSSQPFNPNHVPDGNMEGIDTSDWVATGAAVLAKDTSTVRSGTQSLEVDPVGGGGVESTLSDMTAALIFTAQTGDSISGPDSQGVMTYTDNSTSRFNGTTAEEANAAFFMSGSAISANNGLFPITYRNENNRQVVKFYNPGGVAESYVTTTKEANIEIRHRYEIVLWAANGDAIWTVEVDPGTGVYAPIGSIPNNGGTFTKYHYAFATEGSGDCKIRISVGSAADPIYIDSIMVFRSIFEYLNAKDERVSSPDTSHFAYKNGIAVNHYGVAGIVTDLTNQFSTGAGDNYSPGAHDVGKFLVLWDPTNNKNSGAYKILTDEGGGVVSVDMRSGTALFTGATGLSWRIVDIDRDPTYGHIPSVTGPIHQRSVGFGLESPHSTKWRMFFRVADSGGDSANPVYMWSAPVDTDFDQSTGHFYIDSGPSVLKYKNPSWTYDHTGPDGRPGWSGGEGYFNVGFSNRRLYMMIDEDFSFFTFYIRDVTSSFDVWGLLGYHDSDTYHPEEMAFVSLIPWGAVKQNAVYWAASSYYPGYYGLSYSHTGDAARCTIAQLGIGTGTSAPHNQSNAGVNPWSGKEWITPFRLVNDPFGTEGVPSERDAGVGWGVFQGRYNIDVFTTFDSESYIHFRRGLIWEWPGEEVIP